MTSENKNSVLEVENLSIGYISKKERTLISEGINFSFNKGQLIGLVGANGIGKSTLLRTLAGMQQALKGDIIINGNLVQDISVLQLATDLSIVLTEAPASKNLTVLELVSLGRQPYTNWMGSLSEKDKKSIKKALIDTEVETLQHKKCYELSDGQLQRVLIARALTQGTPIILMDEPTTHLDLYHRAYILKLLKKLTSENNKTILFSTHEIDLAIQMSDAMLVMTSEKTHFDCPGNLIKQEVFKDLFPKEIIEFDGESGRFVLR